MQRGCVCAGAVIFSDFKANVAIVIVWIPFSTSGCAHREWRNRRVNVDGGVTFHVSQHFIGDLESLGAHSRWRKGACCIVIQRHGNPCEGGAFMTVVIPARDDDFLESSWGRFWNGRPFALGDSESSLNRCHGCKGYFPSDELPKTNGEAVHICIRRVRLVANDFGRHAAGKTQ